MGNIIIRLLLASFINSSFLVMCAFGEVLAQAPGSGIRATQQAHTSLNFVALNISDRGYLGNGFSNPSLPSCRYPHYSPVEHLFFGGLWIGAVDSAGDIHVSTAAYSTPSLTALEMSCEFISDGTPLVEKSNIQTSPYFDPLAIAPQQFEMGFHDRLVSGPESHVPLDLNVQARVLSWDVGGYEDTIILQYDVTNAGATPMSDVYVGLWMDTTVGNTDVTSPYGGGSYPGWNYYDDMNGALRPGDSPGAPDTWLMYEHDGDSDNGMATSWIGTQWLGSTRLPEPVGGQPPVSYNQHNYHSDPENDDVYVPEGETESVPGRYQVMSNGDFDIDPVEFGYTRNWNGLLSVGPFPHLASGETVTVCFAVVCGQDSTDLINNAFDTQEFFDQGFTIVGLEDGGNENADDLGSLPLTPVLVSAVPNPFNPSTKISWDATMGLARITVHDLRGRLVATLMDEPVQAGQGSMTWDGRGNDGSILPAGQYLVYLRQGEGTSHLPVTLVK
jgi:hypothetical protein